ncbi:MAG: DegT/DnrJ/EryC1/StrS family aminotransferase [Chloroflexi bacterium]|nr:DegT/DnrJ/EryC1/StrS family aminotransferase [Chloroflexota bacterium]
MIPMARPVIGDEEIAAVVAVLRSGYLVQGRVVAEFETEFARYIGTQHAIAVSSGTAALHLALLAHGIGPGDEVITTPFSFIATANAILYTGARPLFADICPDTLNLDPAQVAERITPRTRAILPVHLYGHPADMAAIERIARRHGLAVIEDAAQAHGAAIDGRKVGTFGTGCFSLYATKNITTGEGGIITTSDSALAERLRMLRDHGQRARYEHEILGYNLRLTDFQAALGLAQLHRIEELTQRRIANAAYLNRHLAGIVTTPTTRPGCRHVYHQYTVRIPTGRDALARALGAAGIATGIHYPLPIHQQKLYRELGYHDSLPIAEQASREVLSLPVHPALTTEELDQIADTLGRLVSPVGLSLSKQDLSRGQDG